MIPPPDFHQAVEQALNAGVRLRRLKALTKAGLVKKLTAALDDKDLFFPLMVTERLTSLGRADCVPGVCRALSRESLAGSAMKALAELPVEKMEAAFKEGLLPVLIARGSPRGSGVPASVSAAAIALRMDPVSAARDMLLAGQETGYVLLEEVALEIANRVGSQLSGEDIERLAEALLIHRSHPRQADALDIAVRRLMKAGGEVSSPELRTLLETERTRRKTDGQMSRALQRIADSGKDHWGKIHDIHQALDDRFARQGVEVGFNYDQKLELQYMTRPEWLIRTLNCFLCGCENSGSLARRSEMGIPLAEYFDEVGIPGCARALRAIGGVEREMDILYALQKAGKITEDDFDLRYEALEARIEKAESDAMPEGMEECCEALWKHAMQHQHEVLPED